MESTVTDILSVTARLWLGEDPTPRDSPKTVSHHAKHVLPKRTELVLARSGYCVRHAKSRAQHNKARALIKSMYAWRGYTTDSAAALPENSNFVTLEVSAQNKLFGTLTVALDCAEGLFADELYRSEINSLRASGRKVCEIIRLAFNPKYSSKEVIASLFHLAHLYAHRINNATDILIEVNPRHAGFYKRRLGFQQIGEQRHCPRVDAPAVLLRVALEYVEQQIARCAGSWDKNQKSLYPYFFSENEIGASPRDILQASRKRA